MLRSSLSTLRLHKAPQWTRSLSSQSNTVIYTGPLTNVAKKLKLFSVTSLGLAGGISPFVFAIDVPVPFAAKAALVGAALATSAASTGLIQWVMSPYVTKITKDTAKPNQLTIHTLNFFARDHATTVPIDALAPSTRIFTSLMVADQAQAIAQVRGKPAKPKALFYVHPELCEEEGEMKSIVEKTGIGKGF
ncbi:hypothetical protein EC973_004043 [Apophysomyces ossiformis]|uniref:Uncharacterized protein n=1 Tax=Apophysomyces ossiformis TaxID=679940 RepID=A0A8H7BXL4_9FUNG|nr:hypothetical protein EC973_004043 [Apophysomyces ossiformis]